MRHTIATFVPIKMPDRMLSETMKSGSPVRIRSMNMRLNTHSTTSHAQK